MSDPVKIALIGAGAAVAAVGLWIHFSPYQQCVRAERAMGSAELAEIRCAAIISGYRR